MADEITSAAAAPLASTAPVVINPIVALDSKTIERGGTYQAHGLERHVNTYTLTDSDLDLLESAGPLFALCIAIASFFGSIVVACFLAGATFPSSTQWNAQQWGLFYYAPRGAVVITLVSAILALITGIRRSRAGERIKKESFVPGTYVRPA
jgi:hypothetical protein